MPFWRWRRGSPDTCGWEGSQPGKLALAVARGGSRYEEVSAGELARDALTWSEIFAHRGIRKGTRTVVMIPPGREFCGAVFGLLKLGAPPVFVDPGMGLANLGRAIRRTM